MPTKKPPLPFIPREAMIERAPSFDRLDQRISAIATAGYVLALQMNEFFRPELAYSSFPRAWFEQYTAMDFMPTDPILAWAAANSGSARWSEIVKGARRRPQVLEHAAAYNLRHGVIFSEKNLMIGLNRSFLSCARPDRAFRDTEIAELNELFCEVLALRSLTAKLTPPCREVMALMALGLTQGDAAEKLGISRDTVKKRIERAVKALGARNLANALTIAAQGSIISGYL